MQWEKYDSSGALVLNQTVVNPAAKEDGTVIVASPSAYDFRHGLDVTDPGDGSGVRIAVDESELTLPSTSPDAYEDGVSVLADPTVFDFRHGLDVTVSGTQARVAVDEAELTFPKSPQQVKTEVQGYLTETFSIDAVQGNVAPTAGTIVLGLMPLRAGVTYTNLIVATAALGSGGTASYVCLYNTAGTSQLTTISADIKATLQGGTTADKKVLALGSTYTPGSDVCVYGALVCVGGTPPTIFRGSSNTPGAAPLGSNPRSYAIGGTAQTTLPSTITIATPTQGAFWMALT